MILAYHTIFSAYGFWLPNDQRGSWSDFVRSWELLRFGKATFTEIRASVARRPFDPALREAARRALKHPTVRFASAETQAIADGFAQAIEESGYTVHACSILPEHVHIVALRHAHKIEQIVAHVKGRATQHLKRAGLWPHAHSPWAQDSWDVYLDSTADIVRSIPYVEGNPEKERLPRQSWPFVTPYPV